MINSLEDLHKLLKLCRKQGVTEIDLGAVKLKLGALPEKRQQQDDTDEQAPEMLTPEQLLNYNVTGMLDADLQS